MKKNKKGGMTPDTIAKVAILVLSAVILLIVIMNIDLRGVVDQTSCHNSIILRSAARIGTLTEIGTKTIPLKCKTEKYCVTNTQIPLSPDYKVPEKNLQQTLCPDIQSTPENVANTRDLLDKGLRETKQKYLDFLAEQIYSCHKMVGEGNANFMDSNLLSKNYCVICSRIQLDPRIAKEIANGGGVSYKELYETMAKKKAENGKSYLEEVYKMKDPILGKVFFDEVIKKAYENDPTVKDFDWTQFKWENWKIPLSGQVAIITSINEGGYGWKVVTGVVVGTVVLGSILLAAPTAGASLTAIPATISIVGTTTTVAAIVTLSAKAVPTLVQIGKTVKTVYNAAKTGVEMGGAVYTFTSATAGMDYSPPSIQVYDVETLRSLECNSFETAP